jgi:hypothetical protein
MVNALNGYQVGNTTVIDSSRNLTNIGNITAALITTSRSGVSASFDRTDNDAIIELKRNGTIRGFIGANTSNDIKFYNQLAASTLTISSSGNIGTAGTISSGGITTIGASVFNGTSATDPDATSRTRYPAANMFTHTSQANGVSIIGGQGSYTGCSLTIGEETGRSANFKFIKGISDTNGAQGEEFSIDGKGNATFAGNISVGNSDGGNQFFKRPSANYIFADQTGGYLVFGTNGLSTSLANASLTLDASKNASFGGSITSGAITSSGIVSAPYFIGGSGAYRVKFSVWTGTTYGIGMKTGFTYGGLGNEYAMCFQMNSTANRGWWWGNNIQTDAQGAMALTNEGKLTVAHSMRLGHGVSDTTTPGATHALDVSGSIASTGAVQGSRFADASNPTNYFVHPASISYVHEIRVDDYIRHNGDTNTHILFSADRIKLTAGNILMLDCVEGGTDYIDIISRVRVTAGGDLECEGNITAYSTTSISDINQKENIQQISDPIEKVKQISGYTFDWKNTGEHSGGVIAQEVEQVMPDVVKEVSIRDGDEMKAVDYQAIIGLLVETVKDLNKRIEDLENGNN